MQKTIKQALRSCNACLRFSVDLGAPQSGRFYYFSARLPAKQVKPIAGSALFILKKFFKKLLKKISLLSITDTPICYNVEKNKIWRENHV